MCAIEPYISLLTSGRPLVFLCFQGVYEETNGMKFVNQRMKLLIMKLVNQPYL